jgi:hypothetical protein
MVFGDPLYKKILTSQLKPKLITSLDSIPEVTEEAKLELDDAIQVKMQATKAEPASNPDAIQAITETPKAESSSNLVTLPPMIPSPAPPNTTNTSLRSASLKSVEDLDAAAAELARKLKAEEERKAWCARYDAAQPSGKSLSVNDAEYINLLKTYRAEMAAKRSKSMSDANTTTAKKSTTAKKWKTTKKSTTTETPATTQNPTTTKDRTTTKSDTVDKETPKQAAVNGSEVAREEKATKTKVVKEVKEKTGRRIRKWFKLFYLGRA